MSLRASLSLKGDKLKVKCTIGVSFGATGDVYVAGEEYDIPAKLVTDYPKYFEKMATAPKNKAKKTQVNK